MKNFKLTIEYDGTAYHGWQIQKKARTIQQEIQQALELMTRQKIVLNGSGRTDAGVHAMAQTANFKCTTDLSAHVFQKGLNSLLDDDIVILDCQEVPENFHARFDAKAKTYKYRILNRDLPSAIDRNYVWFIRSPLNIENMNQAAKHIIGTHDFKSFEGTGSPRIHTIRSITKAEFTIQDNGFLSFHIQGNGFLRYMVRNIVGTLADAGLEKISPDEFRQVLLSKNRNNAGITAPAQGLFLMCVDYES
ncbi:tRNA pseudouridine synthase A [Desulfonema limicola]|uniref:tRNA pseudouridine synthase A n=1 Tax=Desulfonema limicola TaxID=45656 RepID=A0A975BBJ8_9BACT|nr:tRNA pseudouridine(38-40) synthase TruA [Desulfonema limicola]QTA82387.1 tRNA pseudouridine synthase A [Desulfonema limicola]